LAMWITTHALQRFAMKLPHIASSVPGPLDCMTSGKG
jgi:hypothetical protein